MTTSKSKDLKIGDEVTFELPLPTGSNSSVLIRCHGILRKKFKQVCDVQIVSIDPLEGKVVRTLYCEKETK